MQIRPNQTKNPCGPNIRTLEVPLGVRSHQLVGYPASRGLGGLRLHLGRQAWAGRGAFHDLAGPQRALCGSGGVENI